MSKPLTEEELFAEICVAKLAGVEHLTPRLWAIRKGFVKSTQYPSTYYYIIEDSDWNHESFYWFRTEAEALQFQREWCD